MYVITVQVSESFSKTPSNHILSKIENYYAPVKP